MSRRATPHWLLVGAAPHAYVCCGRAILAYSADSGLRAQSRSKAASSAPRIDLRPSSYPAKRSDIRCSCRPSRTQSAPERFRIRRVFSASRHLDATIKLEVLGGRLSGCHFSRPESSSRQDAGRESNAPAAPMRIRTTYEHSTANVKSDSPTGGEESSRVQAAGRSSHRIHGRDDGHVSDVRGLEGVIDDESGSPGRRAMDGASFRTGDRCTGVALGQSWNSRNPPRLCRSPALIWRSNSTYLRNEPASLRNPPNPVPRELCASFYPPIRSSQKQLRDSHH